MKMLQPFTAHPASVGETYGAHLRAAGGFGGRMILAGCACLLHGLLPFLFVRTGSRAVDDLHRRMVTGRRRPAAAAPPAPAREPGSASPVR